MHYRPPNIDDIYACLQCGYCQSVCPIYEEVGWESSSPRGKVFYLKQLTQRTFMDRILRRKIEPNEKWIRTMNTCTLCGRCQTICHVEINFPEVWEEIKEWMVKNGMGPLDVHRMMYDSIMDYHNPFQSPIDKRDEWTREDFTPKEKADIVLFFGCNIAYNLFKVEKAVLKILQKAEADFTTLGTDEWCCGAPLVMTGQVDKFDENALHNISEIEKRDASRVVTGCPGCYRTLKRYSKVKDLNFEVLHTSELIAELLDEDKLTFRKEFPKKVTYHDPCELGRLGGVFEPPRKIIESIPGISFEELPNNRMDSKCCGGGGLLKAIETDMAIRIGTKKVEDAMNIGVDSIISCCPSCKQTITQGIQFKKDDLKSKNQKFKMKMLDITELVARLV